ncbi:hypothetical protein C8T65DRAFT_104890 [Cerioporus squamosus]|nr:hypothetical protein C8T65DRAFT_104890 [Cerioporus squamosus]
MPGSTVSLESLSSPSPSPPPPEPNHDTAPAHDGGLDSGSELSELTEEEQDNDNRAKEDDGDGTSTRKKKQRGHIVPEPMWNWAMRKKKPEKKDWDNKFEEEEEEEQAGPAKAMEEEEGDEEDKGAHSDRDVSLDKDDALTDNEAADDDDDDPPEAEGESGDEATPRVPRKTASGDVSGDEQDDPEFADDNEPDIQQSPKPVASPDLTDDENEDVGEEEIEEEDVQDAEPATKEGSEVDEEEEDIVPDDVEVPDVDEAPTTGAATPANGVDDVVDADADATMDVDAQPAVLMSPVAVAASSIMAGASLLQPASPSSSQPSTPSGSRASSRFPSAEPEQEQDVPSEPEAEPEPERRAAGGRGGRARKGKGRTRAPRRSRAAAAADAEADGDLDNADLGEGEGADADDDVATPDVDLDSDMQPAHRAEALDVLAAIELKFALLRERLYVEKMDSLAWEEGLIADGTHPELLHLHAELSNRRDKRLELAARRRDYEVENVRKRRRLDEAGAWSTWKNDRDELQKTMIAETNGKKRRLERERRLIERPPPTRRFPIPLHEVPPAPTLREIVKNSPFGVPDSASSLGKRSRKKEPSSHVPLAYPTLEPLSRHEVIQDLEMFWQHQRNAPIGYNPHSHMPGLMNAVLGGGIPHGMEPYAMGMPVIDGPGPARFVQQPHIPQQGMVQNFGPHPRLSHHHSAPPGALSHLSHAQQVQLEQELQAGMRQPSGMPPHPTQFGPGPGPGALLRRSISPVPLSNGAGPSASVPTTLGGGPVPPGFSGPKPNGWSGPQSSAKESKRMNGDADVRERERMAEVMAQRERADRERAQRDLDREREREAERAYHMSHAQPRHSAHTHQHGAAPGQAAHHHGPHNHPHHHHHVHHHHHPPQQGFNGPGGNAHAPPMAPLPSGSNPGPANPSLSPHSVREFDQRRPRSGAPTEVIELSAATQKPTASPGMSAFWLGNEEPGPPGNDHPRERERERERGRAPGPLGPPQPGPNERLMTPFTMGPSQTLQRSLPGSPRNPLVGAGPSNPPPSIPSSRRGSWSLAAEDARPLSASHRPTEPMPGSSTSQRPPTTRLPQPPSTSAYHSPFGSPPRNGRALPGSPSATPFSGPLRSPVRGNQQGRVPIGGPGPLSPPPSLPLSPRAMGSPGSKLPRMPSPPLTRAPLPKLGGFPIPESGNIAPIMSATSGTIPPAPSTLLPPLSATLPPPGAPTARMSSGPLSEKVPQLPPTKAVPVSVDGS